MSTVAGFPFITAPEFRVACHDLAAKLGSVESLWEQHDWIAVRVDEASNGDTMLVIVKTLEGTSCLGGDCSAADDEIRNDVDELSEDDPEALVRSPVARLADLEIQYDILLSATYQVPVLYFLLRRSGDKSHKLDMDFVYDNLVPSSCKAGLRNAGVMGGMSIANHPISGIPSFFIHPCSTPEALRCLNDTQNQITAADYLLMWLGLVGGCVGLTVPGVFVSRMQNANKHARAEAVIFEGAR